MNQRCMTQGWRFLVRGLLLPLVVGLIGIWALPAAANEDIAGTWRALMKTPQADIEIVLTLDVAEGVWSGTISDPTGSGRDLEPEALTVDANTISFNFRPEGTPFPASFFGNYLAEDDVIRGTFSIAGRSSPLTRFERTSPLPESLAPAEGEEAPRGRQRHFHKFGLVARVNYWLPIHFITDEERTINDITTGEFNYDGALRWYLMDGLAVFGRVFRGGQGFDTNQGNLDRFAEIGLTKDSHLKMDGVEFGFNAYTGNSLFPNSPFNPFVSFAVGQTDWQLTETGRGSDPLTIDDQALEDKSWHVGAGLGSEFEISHRLALELEWFWRYTMTEDKEKWPDNTAKELWTDTHVWNLTFGLVVNF